MHRLKKFEVKKDLNGNIFVIRNDVWFSDIHVQMSCRAN